MPAIWEKSGQGRVSRMKRQKVRRAAAGKTPRASIQRHKMKRRQQKDDDSATWQCLPSARSRLSSPVVVKKPGDTNAQRASCSVNNNVQNSRGSGRDETLVEFIGGGVKEHKKQRAAHTRPGPCRQWIPGIIDRSKN